MEKFKLVYEISEHGGSIQLLSVTPITHKCNYLENCFYEGKVLQQVYLEDDGVYEINVVHIFEEDYDHFGIVSLEKVYGS